MIEIRKSGWNTLDGYAPRYYVRHTDCQAKGFPGVFYVKDEVRNNTFYIDMKHILDIVFCRYCQEPLPDYFKLLVRLTNV